MRAILSKHNVGFRTVEKDRPGTVEHVRPDISDRRDSRPPLAMKPSEHVLHHVFGRLLVADEQHREPHKTEPMPAPASRRAWWAAVGTYADWAISGMSDLRASS